MTKTKKKKKKKIRQHLDLIAEEELAYDCKKKLHLNEVFLFKHKSDLNCVSKKKKKKFHFKKELFQSRKKIINIDQWFCCSVVVVVV